MCGLVMVLKQRPFTFQKDPEGQADDVTMDDAAEDGADKKADTLPNLEVRIEKEDAQEPQQVEEVQEEVQEECQEEVPEEPMEGVGSQEREETQEERGDSEETEKPVLPPANSPQERYGNFIMSQFSAKEYLQIRPWVFNLTSGLSEQERRDRGFPVTPDDVNTMATAMFIEVIAFESHRESMSTYPQFTNTDVDSDTFHSIQLSCRRIKEENEHITITSFEEKDNPEIPEDPQDTKEMEHMTPENKHIILETDNSVLIDCAVQWMKMINADLQKRIWKEFHLSRTRLKMSRTKKKLKKKSNRSLKYLLLLRLALRCRQIFQVMHLNLETLNKERYQLLLQALTKERKQKKRKASMLMTRLLPPKDLQP